MKVARRICYRELVRVVNCIVVASCGFGLVIGRAFARYPNTSAANDLVSRSWLGVVEMVRGIIEFGDVCELNRVQGPNNVCIPGCELNLAGFPATLLLELL